MMMMPPQPVSPTSPMSIPPLSSAFRPPMPVNQQMMMQQHHHQQQQQQQHSGMVAHGSMDPFGAEHPMLSISYRVPTSASALPSSGLVLPHSSLAHPLSTTTAHAAPFLARRPSITPTPPMLTPPTTTPTTTTASSADLLFAAHYQQSRGGPAPFDPGMDYAGLYHYAPADIKHRKRTTREQLKILEETYAKDQKPNAALRKSLSETLQMTPRGVQVWFQNRRAKDKANLKKQQAIAAEEANAASSKSKLSGDEKEIDNTAASAASSAEPENRSSPIEPEKESPSPAKEATPSPHLQPPSLPAAVQRRGSAPNLLGSPSKLPELPPRPLPESVVPPTKQRLAGTGLTLEQIHNVRRGSMPASVLASVRQQALHPQLQPPAVPNVDQFGRRRSLDPTQPNLRLSQHPYASLVMNNGSMTGSPGLIGRRSSGMFLGQSLSPELNEPQRRSLLHRPSMQYGMRTAAVGEFANHQRTASGPVNPQLAGMSSRNYPMVPRRSNLPYAFPPRVMEQPSSGPLPAPDFSFGSAVAQPVEEGEEEDLVSPATSFDSYRRFGSFASAADSDTSASQASVYSRFGSIAGSEHLGMEVGNLSGEASPGQEQFRARFSGLEVKQDGPTPSTSSAAMLFAARTANLPRPQIKLDGATYPYTEDYSVASTSSNPDVGLGLVTPTATQFDYPSEGVVYPSLSPSVSSTSSSTSSLGLPVNPACSPYDQSLAMPLPHSAHVSPADLAPLPFAFDLPQAPFPQLQDLDAQLAYTTGFPTTNFDGSPLNMDQVPTLTTLTSQWPTQ